MNRPKKFLSYVVGTLVLLTAATAVTLAQKGKGGGGTTPPPPPPPIVFDIVLTGIIGQPRSMNDAGDMTIQGMIVLAGTSTPIDANFLLQDPNWSIKTISVLNNNLQVGCRAQYLGETDEESQLVQGTDYYGLLNCRDGSFTRLFEPIPGARLIIEDLNDHGMLCGAYSQEGYMRAFVTGPEENSGIHEIFPEDAGLIPSFAKAINNNGQVAGRRGSFAYRWTPETDDSPESLVILPGKVQDSTKISDSSSATDINEAGEMSVWANGPASVKGYGSTAEKACRYEGGSGLIQLTTRDSFAKSITDDGDVMGSFKWTSPDEHFIHLKAQNALVSLSTSGVVQGSAADVARWKNEGGTVIGMNNNREIFGYFYNDQQAFVLVPRP